MSTVTMTRRPLFSLAPGPSPFKLKKKKKLRPVPVPPTPPPSPEPQTELQLPQMTVVENDKDKDTTFEDLKEKLSNPKRFIWILIAAAGAVVLYILSKVVKFGGPTTKPMEDITRNEELEMEKERYEAEKRLYESKRLELRDIYASLLDRRNKIIERLRNNWEEAQRNHRDFKGMFATAKASYDEDITGYEEEQNLGTAFMLKADIDDRKQNMIKAGEHLGKEKEQLIMSLKDTDNKLSQTIGIYNQSYDDKLTDPRQAQPNAVPQSPPPNPAVEQARRDYRQRADPDENERFIRDGTGREQMPN